MPCRGVNILANNDDEDERQIRAKTFQKALKRHFKDEKSGLQVLKA